MGRTFDSGFLIFFFLTQNVSAYLLATCVYAHNPPVCVCVCVCVCKNVQKCDVLSTTNAHPHSHAGIPGDDRTSFKSLSRKRSSSSFTQRIPSPFLLHTLTHAGKVCLCVCVRVLTHSFPPPTASILSRVMWTAAVNGWVWGGDRGWKCVGWQNRMCTCLKREMGLF